VNETIHVRPLLDPIIDTLGHDPRSPYPERFWLPTLGPTALALLRLIAYRFDRAEHGFVLDLAVSMEQLWSDESTSRVPADLAALIMSGGEDPARRRQGR